MKQVERNEQDLARKVEEVAAEKDEKERQVGELKDAVWFLSFSKIRIKKVANAKTELERLQKLEKEVQKKEKDERKRKQKEVKKEANSKPPARNPGKGGCKCAIFWFLLWFLL